MNKDLEEIKAKYGEKMAHLCRELFSTLLETEGLLTEILTSKFNEDRFLYETIVDNNMESDFRNYIYSFVDISPEAEIETDKTPKELMSDAGYDLYECQTEEEIQSFKRYYQDDEALCTFRNNRLDSCYVFFAVKKNVDEIKRENFTDPKRQDEYGTSVISIQFSRDESNHLSIKNRYNHKVNNPDATFNNNLDNITPGLSAAFKKMYDLNLVENKSNFELPNYVFANDGKLYKYNQEIDNIYFCPNNIVIENGVVEKYDREKYILIDHYLIDLQSEQKSIKSLLDGNDSFTESFGTIKKVGINGNEISIENSDQEKARIKLNKYNQIVSLFNPFITKIGTKFLYYNKTIEELNIPLVTKIDDWFLYWNQSLREINVSSVTKIGDRFLSSNRWLKEFDAPLVRDIGDNFLINNSILEKIYLPLATKIGSNFLCCNKALKQLEMPLVTQLGEDFMFYNLLLEKLSMPSLRVMKSGFLWYNTHLRDLYVPLLKEAEYSFLNGNRVAREQIILQMESRKRKFSSLKF